MLKSMSLWFDKKNPQVARSEWIFMLGEKSDRVGGIWMGFRDSFSKKINTERWQFWFLLTLNCKICMYHLSSNSSQFWSIPWIFKTWSQKKTCISYHIRKLWLWCKCKIILIIVNYYNSGKPMNNLMMK